MAAHNNHKQAEGKVPMAVDGPLCSHCTLPLADGSHVTRLQCHCFHTECLGTYYRKIRKSVRAPGCPVCNAPLPDFTTIPQEAQTQRVEMDNFLKTFERSVAALETKRATAALFGETNMFCAQKIKTSSQREAAVVSFNTTLENIRRDMGKLQQLAFNIAFANYRFRVSEFQVDL